MYISTNDWLNYIDKLSKLNKKAADAIVAYVQKNGFGDTDALISYANAVVQTYGSGSAALSAAMYDATAEAAGYFYEPAEPAPLPEYGEVAKTIKGTLKKSQNVNELAGAVSRLVKRTGADTTLQNAYRDRPRKKYGKKKNTGAQIAWVPHGDTCPFCLMLASNGWRNQTVGGAQNHAEHIHSNCDCTYAVRFDERSGVVGYDPDRYKEMFDDIEGDSWREKVNAMRRQQYSENGDKIRAQKREAYAQKNRVRSNSVAPDYKRNAIIDKIEDVESLKALFPEVTFDDSFDKIKLESQIEIAQGLDFMKTVFGQKSLPNNISSVYMDDYGRTQIRSGKVRIKRNIDTVNAFSTICHECIHVYDGKRGLISEKIIEDIKNMKEYKGKAGNNRFSKDLLDLLGIDYYNKYKNDSLEIIAYAYEESLYKSKNRLVELIIDKLMEG